MSEENKAIVRRIYDEVWSKGNLDTVEVLYTDDFVLHDPAQPGVKGIEGYKQIVVGNRAAFPDMNFTVEEQLSEGNKVATRWVATATHQGEFAGVPATGKSGTITGTTIHYFKEGKVVQEKSNWDTLGLLQMIGVVPPMGGG